MGKNKKKGDGCQIYSDGGTWADVLLSRQDLDREVEQLAANEKVLAAMLAAYEEYGDMGMICIRAFPDKKAIPQKYNVHQWRQITTEFMWQFRNGRLHAPKELRDRFAEFFQHESSQTRKG